MNPQVLKSGTVVCSAILVSGWGQSLVSELTDDCGNQSAKTAPPNQVRESENHCLKQKAIAPILHPPEAVFNLQWGDRKPNKLPTRMEAMYADLLNQAQEAASREQFAKAISAIAGIPRNSRHYETAQQLQADWSRELLRQATNQWQQAQIQVAIATLNQIPAGSQLGDRVTELKQHWKQQAMVLRQAIAAQKAGNWQQVIDTLHSLEGSPLYHSLPVQKLLQQSITNLYEPDHTLLQIATADLPTAQIPTVVAPEMF
ncbi:hypothetical protein J5X98_17805 [Leptothermofonsia sichuanensis E412]|uniref:hypothetical protein n=1 Tax=Leptothermofonsia sichuanensis TaxID=2917832 RepID=UPI001CA62A33|nr:hypothetical protein [Leptothermofonsia sichuanensis]QZZ19245.1 hypothetical protein J5X98_17805 [Leptothermofonsia sichuanensis E412]